MTQEFTAWINEYYLVKPHYDLGIYTPHEKYYDNNLQTDFTEDIKTARMKRLIENKKINCTLSCGV